MREQISRLMDGDLEGAEADAAFRDLKNGDGLDHWVCYHVIGDSLRRCGTPTPGFAERFAARLYVEPTVLAPKPSHGSRLPWAWAAAATVAAVLVVGSVAVSMLDPQPIAIAKAREANVVRAAQSKVQPVSPDYLIAHQEYSPTTQIQGVGPYLRAVSAGGVDGRP
ncbi:MAG: sigma-E factor negative regulatory protein [Casimicrobiaceae bacterium]